MFFRLLAAFILIPLVELFLLLWLAETTSAFTTLALVIVTGIIGSALARREGVGAWYRFQNALAEQRLPSREIQDGLMIVFAAALLLTPGLLTDGVGFLLLIPLGRNWVRRLLVKRYGARFKVNVMSSVTGFQEDDIGENDIEYYHPTRDAAGKTIDGKAFER